MEDSKIKESSFILKAECISQTYLNEAGASLSLIQGTSFEVQEGEVVTILGAASSGKSALLRIIAGIEKPTAGTVTFAQYKDLRTDAAFIPTEPSSLPWLSVSDNIRFAVKGEKDPDQVNSRIKEVIEAVGLNGYENHIPANKSAGFRFRIALARALASEAKVILIDDPFRDLLPERKMNYYRLIREVSAKMDFSILWATADITEALLISDRILLLAKEPGGTPGAIVKEFRLEKGRMPAVSLLASKEYAEIRHSIEQSLYS
ncbi:MAG TPA: ATP-binding cassette domain-containing protein [Ignavibacteriales bacterium]|nr:ATP-binding cassette domain-containing protein [Ignavibacteriales bacterium]